jgi:hypothetical protein
VEMISIGYSGYLKSLTCAYRSAVKTAGMEVDQTK